MKYLGNVKIDVLEPTENSYNFFGNLRKPFTLLTMLAKRSIPVDSKSKSAGFFFGKPTQDLIFSLQTV